jgi:hypothetical protein
MPAAMDRALHGSRRWALWALIVLAGSPLAGCAHSHRRERTRPTLLGAWSPRKSRPAIAPSLDPAPDTIAQRLNRPEHAMGLAGTTSGARHGGQTTTRSTAPPPGAVLSAAPTSVAAAPTATGDALDLESPPPLDPPAATEAPRVAVESGAEPAREPRPAEGDLVEIRRLVNQSRETLGKIGTYQVRMSRQERVGDQLQPAEDVVLSIRREPRAVRLEWPDGPNQGREVIYVSGADGGLMHIRMPNALVPRLSLPPDSPLALRNSRHPITEAGLDAVLEKLDETVRAHESASLGADQLRYDGIKQPLPDGPSCHTLVRVTPQGETWVVSIDVTSHLPFLVQATAADGGLLERYVFREPKSDLPELASATAFDPDSRWGATKGLFGRLTRSPESQEGTAAPITR